MPILFVLVCLHILLLLCSSVCLLKWRAKDNLQEMVFPFAMWTRCAAVFPALVQAYNNSIWEAEELGDVGHPGLHRETLGFVHSLYLGLYIVYLLPPIHLLLQNFLMSLNFLHRISNDFSIPIHQLRCIFES